MQMHSYSKEKNKFIHEKPQLALFISKTSSITDSVVYIKGATYPYYFNHALEAYLEAIFRSHVNCHD